MQKIYFIFLRTFPCLDSKDTQFKLENNKSSKKNVFFLNLFNKSETKKIRKFKKQQQKNNNKPNNMILKELITNFLLFGE